MLVQNKIWLLLSLQCIEITVQSYWILLSLLSTAIVFLIAEDFLYKSTFTNKNWYNFNQPILCYFIIQWFVMSFVAHELNIVVSVSRRGRQVQYINLECTVSIFKVRDKESNGQKCCLPPRISPEY